MLSIGSIIYLTEGNKKVMILNRGAFLEQKGEKVFFDYVGTMYPSGLASEQLYYFNEENIDKVVFEGFQDEEEARFVVLYEKWLAEQEDLKKGDVSMTPDGPVVGEK